MEYPTADELLQPQGPPPPDEPLPPARKRKLYRSCDYCRKRRRACDATKLGIGPFAQSTSDNVGPLAACTNCQKTHRICTFEWLRSLKPENVPRGVQATLSTTGFWSPSDEGNDPENFEEAVLPDTSVLLGGSSLASVPQDVASGDNTTSASFTGQPAMYGPSESKPTPSLSRTSSENNILKFNTDMAGPAFQRSYSGSTEGLQTATRRSISDYTSQLQTSGSLATGWNTSGSRNAPSWRRLSDQTGMFPSQTAFRSSPLLRNPPIEQMSPIPAVPTPVITQAGSATTFSHLATSSAPSSSFFFAQGIPTSGELNVDDLSSIDGFNPQHTLASPERRLFEQRLDVRQRNFGGTCKDCHSRGLLVSCPESLCLLLVHGTSLNTSHSAMANDLPVLHAVNP